jgi:Subtilase family
VHRRPLHLLPPAALLLLAAVTPLAAAPPATGGGGFELAASRHGEDRLLAPDGEVIRATAAAMVDARRIPVPEAGVELYLWDEVDARGGRRSFYAVAAAGGGPRGRVREARNSVELVDTRFDPLLEGAPAPPPGLAADAGNRLFLVQLVVTPLPELQRLVAEQGGRIHRYLTEHTLLVEMDAAARERVAALPFVRWVGAYQPAWRLAPAPRDALLAGGGDLAADHYSVLLTERGGAAQRGLARTIAGWGGSVDALDPRGFRMQATLTGTQLARLIHDDRVQYVDRWGPMEVDMDIVREVGGADYVEAQTGFTGQGIHAEIFDTELRTTHQEFDGATPLIHSTGTTSSSFHGTSVTSNVFARGTSPMARGMLPSGDIIFFRATEAIVFGGTKSRYDINAELLDPLGPYRALFQTSSVGSPLTTAYTTISAETDDNLFLNQILSTQSQSNAGSQQSRPQAWAKNIVSVGGFRHQNTADRSDDHWGGSGSIGPAADGRIKPDLSFFYDSIFSATGTGDTSYTSFGGTSSATPQTAGHFGLLFQLWHEGIFPGHGGGPTAFDDRPHMATAKALMINHAHRYAWTPGGPASNDDLDRYKQGWGTADVRNLLDDGPATSVIDESVVLPPLGSYSKTVEIAPGTPELRVTLAYVDPMGTPGAGNARVNDLSLKVTSPSAVVYWGDNGLVDDNVSDPGGSSNTVDTVENVFLVAPEAGTWTVEVLADEVVEDNHPETPAVDADFALVIFPDVQVIFGDGFESGDTSAWSAAVP